MGAYECYNNSHGMTFGPSLKDGFICLMGENMLRRCNFGLTYNIERPLHQCDFTFKLND